MTGILIIAGLLILLVVFDLVAMRWGVDSTEVFPPKRF